MILDVVKVKEEVSSGELSLTRNGRIVGSIKMKSTSGTTMWSVSFGGKELSIFDNSTKATTEMIAPFQIDTNGTFSGMCYQVHAGGLFSKYDILELRYQSLPYKLYPISPNECRALPIYYGNWQVASIESDFNSTSLFRDGQILAEDDKAAIVALAFFCYCRSNLTAANLVSNKKINCKIDSTFPSRIKP